MKKIIRAVCVMLCMIMIFSMTVIAKSPDVPEAIVQEMRQNMDTDILTEFGSISLNADDLKLVEYYGEVGGYHIGVFWPNDRYFFTVVGELVIGDYKFVFPYEDYANNLFAYKDGEFILHSKYDFSELLSEDELKELADAAGASLASSPAHKLSDVDFDAWYGDAVRYCFEMAIMSGMGNDIFAPHENLTRAQTVQLLFNLSGESKDDYKGETRFEDVGANAWCAPAVNWAEKNNITEGVDENHFAPNKDVTRQELARFLYEYAYSTGKYDMYYDIDLEKYEDVDQIADWAYFRVAWAVNAGIISGITETTIAPRESATRAQTAMMLMKFDEYLKENERITTGAFTSLKEYIIENGEYGGGYWPDTYIYHFNIGEFSCGAEYFTSGNSDWIELYVCGEQYGQHLYTGSHAMCMEHSNITITGLKSEYEFSYYYDSMGENENPDVNSKGMLSLAGYIESEFGHGDYIPGGLPGEGEYANNSESAEFATQKRDAAVGAMKAFIEHLMTECGLEYNDLFVSK